MGQMPINNPNKTKRATGNLFFQCMKSSWYVSNKCQELCIIFMPHQWAAFLKDTKEISLKQRLQKELAANDESLFEYV